MLFFMGVGTYRVPNSDANDTIFRGRIALYLHANFFTGAILTGYMILGPWNFFVFAFTNNQSLILSG
jgi:hypothetical protein